MQSFLKDNKFNQDLGLPKKSFIQRFHQYTESLELEYHGRGQLFTYRVTDPCLPKANYLSEWAVVDI